MEALYTLSLPGDRFKLHSVLSELKAPCYGLWAFCRGLDVSGVGYVEIALEEICLNLQTKPSTVYRWLKSGWKTWFSDWKNLGKNVFRIYYRSILKVCAENQISDLGAIAFVKPVHLTRSGRKVKAAELEAQLAQHQAYYAAFKSLDKQDAQKLTKSEKVFSSSSVLSPGASRGRDFFKIRPDAPIVPHTTIETVANRLNKSWGTAQYRLSNQYRNLTGFDSLDRKQILRRFSDRETQAYKAALQGNFDSGRSGFNPISQTFQKILLIGGVYYWVGGNVYNFQDSLKGNRYERSRIRRACTRANAFTQGLRSGL